MSKLKTIKGKAAMTEYTDYVALKANATRWSGNYRMVKRFWQFRDAIDDFLNDADEAGILQTAVAELMPTAGELLLMKELDLALHEFQTVSLELQKSDGEVSLLDVRVLFDSLIASYGADFTHYLAPDAQIVNNPAFENAIVQFLRDEDGLSMEDRAQLKCFELTEADIEEENAEDEEGAGTGALVVMKRHRKRKRVGRKYVQIELLPITSNIVERFFSQVKLNLTYLRNSLLPSTLETIMFLKMNKSFMSKMTVQTAMNKINLN